MPACVCADNSTHAHACSSISSMCCTGLVLADSPRSFYYGTTTNAWHWHCCESESHTHTHTQSFVPERGTLADPPLLIPLSSLPYWLLACSVWHDVSSSSNWIAVARVCVRLLLGVQRCINERLNNEQRKEGMGKETRADRTALKFLSFCYILTVDEWTKKNLVSSLFEE